MLNVIKLNAVMLIVANDTFNLSVVFLYVVGLDSDLLGYLISG
jgi:hypothetical protein